MLHRAFYHFFFAILLPLCEISRTGIFGKQKIYIRSCGRFDPILKEINGALNLNLKLIPSLDVLPVLTKTGANLDFFILDSMEGHYYRNGRFCIRPFAYDGERLRAISSHVRSHLKPMTSSPACQYYGNRSDVTMILRGGGLSGHGNSSRSVLNAGVIVSALQSEGFSVSTFELEGKSLSEQIAIFDSAKIVLAQHGAALSNLVWTRPGRPHVIEIVPPKFAQPGWHYFDALCSAMQIPREEIRQSGNVSAVDPDEVVKRVRSIIFSI